MTIITQIISTTVSNYPLTTSLVILGSSAIIYINNNDYINKKTMSCAWTSIRLASQLQIWYNDMFSNCCCFWYSNDNIKRTLYIISEGKIVSSETILQNNIVNRRINYDLIIFKYPNPDNPDTFVYNRYQEVNETLVESSPIKGLFLTVNIKYGGKSYEIDNINNLTIPNTRIFDRSYMQWYMQYFHDLEIFDDDYHIELLDNNMDQVTFDHTKFINITNDGYNINNNVSITNTVWRSILAEQDIPDNLPENKKITLADISSPPLTATRCGNTGNPSSPISLVSNNTDVSFDIIDKSEAN